MGIVRHIDALGRVSLSKELLRKLGVENELENGVYFSFSVDGDTIVLELNKPETHCELCGQELDSKIDPKRHGGKDG